MHRPFSSSSRSEIASLYFAMPSTSQSISTVILVHEFHGSAAPLFRQVFAPPVIQRPFGAYTTAHAATAYSRSPKRWSEIHGAVASAVNARDLYAFLEVKKDFSNWIKKQIERARLVDGRDYTTIAVPPFGGAEGNRGVRLDYYLTIEADFSNPELGVAVLDQRKEPGKG